MSSTPGYEPSTTPVSPSLATPSLVEAIGRRMIDGRHALGDKLDFLGLAVVAFARLLLGRTRHLDLRLSEAFQEAGASTLPIVALIAFASGGVLTILGMQQFDKLGVGLVSTKLVAIVILREIAALTTGIALAGRVGSGNAAQLAAMVADDEVDAMRRNGVEPMDALVAPRLLALVLMGPLLVAYACVLGLLGAAFVGVVVMGVPSAEYLYGTLSALSLKHGIAGLVKGAAYGFLVGMAGCYHGLRSGRSGAEMGRTVQAAVVSAVVGVVLADAAVTLFFKWVRL